MHQCNNLLVRFGHANLFLFHLVLPENFIVRGRQSGNPETESLAVRYGAGHATRPPIFSSLRFGKFIREIRKEGRKRGIFPALYSIQRGTKCAVIHQYEVREGAYLTGRLACIHKCEGLHNNIAKKFCLGPA